jgi:beta-fructofuranosidase
MSRQVRAGNGQWLLRLAGAMLGMSLATIAQGAETMTLTDKTLVAWAKVANLQQQGGSLLTVEQQNCFDAIVFGELSPGRWMAGSDGFRRSQRNQEAWPAETADPHTAVQVAIVYRGQEVTVLRDGVVYATHTVDTAQTFSQPFLLLVGKRHLAAGAPAHFAGSVLDVRLYDRALTPDQVAALRPGLASDPSPLAWWFFADEGSKDRMGHFGAVTLKGGARVENGELLLDGRSAVMVASVSGPTARDPLLTGPVPEEVVRTARLLRERLLADPYRPGYHFAMSEDMAVPGDPNGAFYHKGRYHLMYLYARRASGFCWGHLSSKDLVHWRNHPDALAPDDILDPGIFSGGAFVDDDGSAYLTYWKMGEPQGIGMARSSDRLFETWQKFGDPVIPSTEWGIAETTDGQGRTIRYGVADPSNLWKQDGRYYMLTGNLLVLNKFGREDQSPPEEQGDRLYLFDSDDLTNWRYRHVFYQRRPEWTDRGEDNMCPSFLPLPSAPEGGAPSGKHLLLFIAHNRGCQYYVGDYRDDRFHPDHHGRMSWVDNGYFAPEALIDGKGRQIMWSWLIDRRADDEREGWTGVYGLPRTLWLGEDGTLRMRPVPELEALRLNEQSWDNLALDSGASKQLTGVVGDSCEVHLEIEPGDAVRCGLTVRASPDGTEETLLYYDAAAKELVVDTTRAGAAGRLVIERAPFTLRPDERLSLRVFVDKSIVEIYANDRQAIGRQVFPARSDSLGVSLFAEGGQARCHRVTAWEMMPANPH